MRSMVDTADMIIVGDLKAVSRTTEPETMSGWTSLEVAIDQTLLPKPAASGVTESEPPSTISDDLTGEAERAFHVDDPAAVTVDAAGLGALGVPN